MIMIQPGSWPLSDWHVDSQAEARAQAGAWGFPKNCSKQTPIQCKSTSVSDMLQEAKHRPDVCLHWYGVCLLHLSHNAQRDELRSLLHGPLQECRQSLS